MCAYTASADLQHDVCVHRIFNGFSYPRGTVNSRKPSKKSYKRATYKTILLVQHSGKPKFSTFRLNNYYFRVIFLTIIFVIYHLFFAVKFLLIEK